MVRNSAKGTPASALPPRDEGFDLIKRFAIGIGLFVTFMMTCMVWVVLFAESPEPVSLNLLSDHRKVGDSSNEEWVERPPDTGRVIGIDHLLLEARSNIQEPANLFSLRSGKPFQGRKIDINRSVAREWIIKMRLSTIRIRKRKDFLTNYGRPNPSLNVTVTLINTIFHHSEVAMRLNPENRILYGPQNIQPSLVKPFPNKTIEFWELRIGRPVEIIVKGPLIITLYEYSVTIELKWANLMTSTSNIWTVTQNLGVSNESLSYKQLELTKKGFTIENLEIGYGGKPPTITEYEESSDE